MIAAVASIVTAVLGFYAGFKVGQRDGLKRAAFDQTFKANAPK